MIRIKSIIINIFLLTSIAIHATGPSWIESQINPIMTNNQGYVLCRTRYSENGMGGGTYNMKYGLCTITNDKIIETTLYAINSMDIEDYEIINKWDNWFKNEVSSDTCYKEEKNLINKYAFSNSDLSLYLRNDTIKIDSFNKKNNINIYNSKNVRALRNAKPSYNHEEAISENILVCYDFKYFILTKNIIDIDGNTIGVTFNYKNKILPIYFELQDIDAVIFKQGKNLIIEN